MGDNGLCDRCRGTGQRTKYKDGSGYVKVACYACHGTGRWHRSDERWPYQNHASR